MDKPRNGKFGNFDEASERGALRDDRVVVEHLARLKLVFEKPVLLYFEKSAFGLGRNLLALGRVLRPSDKKLRRALGGTARDIVGELAVERQVGIAAYRRGEVRVVALRKPEVADCRRVIDRRTIIESVG